MIAPIHSKDYAREWELLEETLEQALQVEDTVAVVTANKILPSKFQGNPRVVFDKFDGPIPTDVSKYPARAKDKTAKRIHGLPVFDAEYYMMLDGDDFVPLGLTKWMRKHRPQDGVFMPDINLICNDRSLFLPCTKLFGNDHETLCGSSIIYHEDTLRSILKTGKHRTQLMSTHGLSPGIVRKHGRSLLKCTDLIPGYRSGTGFNISDLSGNAYNYYQEMREVARHPYALIKHQYYPVKKTLFIHGDSNSVQHPERADATYWEILGTDKYDINTNVLSGGHSGTYRQNSLHVGPHLLEYIDLISPSNNDSWILANVGLNDAWYVNRTKDVRIPPDRFINNLLKATKLAKEKHFAGIIFILPFGCFAPVWPECIKNVDVYRNLMITVGKLGHIDVIPMDKFERELFWTDGVHLNTKGHQHLADIVSKYLQ